MPAALPPRQFSRRALLAAGVATVATGSLLRAAEPVAVPEIEALVEPLSGKRLLLSCKLGMIPGEANGAKLALADRLRMAGEAGFDGVDFDQAGEYTPQQARAEPLGLDLERPDERRGSRTGGLKDRLLDAQGGAPRQDKVHAQVLGVG